MRIPAPTLPVIIGNAVTRIAIQAVHTKSSQSESEENFHTELSRITFYDYILYPSYRYEIYLIRVMYTANSSILYNKEKTVQILGTQHQSLVNDFGLRYSKQIGFQEELINFLRT